MPAVCVVYTHELLCSACGERLGAPPARSLVKNKDRAIILFDDRDPPHGLNLAIMCSNGHSTLVPADFTFELAALTPKDAPAAALIVASGGVTKSGKKFKL